MWKPKDRQADEEWGAQRIPATGEKWQVAKSYEEHESLAYGVDWSHRGLAEGEDGVERNEEGEAMKAQGVDEEGKENTLIASCSFYDHALRTWRG